MVQGHWLVAEQGLAEGAVALDQFAIPLLRHTSHDPTLSARTWRVSKRVAPGTCRHVSRTCLAARRKFRITKAAAAVTHSRSVIHRPSCAQPQLKSPCAGSTSNN